MLEWFKRKTQDPSTKFINSEEYDKCLRRISELSATIKTVESQTELLKSDLANLRGKFNARLSRLKEEEVKEESKDIYTSSDIPFG